MPNDKMKTVPNQRVVASITKDICNNQKGHEYSKDSVKSSESVIRNLTTLGAIKLYLYINKNSETYAPFALSRADFCAMAGVSENTYKSAFKELVEKRYLIQKTGNEYDFYNLPPEIEVPKEAIINRVE